MPMKSLSFFAILSLLALTLPSAIASDPSPLQDFCVGVNTPADGVFVNGKFCKDPKLATADDFFFTGLDKPRVATNAVGTNVTPVFADNLPGLNTLGIAFARVDYAVNGLIPPHTHPRASEFLIVQEGTLLAGFVSSDQDGNRLFAKTLNKGDLIVFPKGLIHYHANVGRVPAVAFTSFNSQNPGLITVANTVFGSNPPINPDILARAFQLNRRKIMDLQAIF
ncbi:hypothetical protein EUTSA_v10027914mg [Eutrema salsugineum]|uniref:Germin-like protein n=1 Tax=Eutrema salsugineum TaxID=72664 RepID=V4LX71_EUTSA|nr:germin-like protein subfamily 1 member 11 [Eutrema salsugineum]ESQ47127.1 hypothetical protein EUTSA_v10027914mg [Eutrema salsugineum]